MTVAVAAPFPWGFLRKAMKGFRGKTLHTIVILGADSRWTYGDRPPDDMGQKLWKLAPERGVGAVYAGDVRSAEEALEACQRRLKLVIRLHPEVVAEVVRGALTEVYAAHNAARADIGPLLVLVGVAIKGGGTSIIRLKSEDGFLPQMEEDIQVIGWPTACEKLMKKLAERDEVFLKGGVSWKVDPTEWALLLAGALFSDVIEPGDEATVGGSVQIAIVRAEEWEDLTVARLSEPIETAEWQLISADPESLHQFRRKHSLPPLASGGFDVGFVSWPEQIAPFAQRDVV